MLATLAIHFSHGCRVEGRTRNDSLLEESRNKLCNISVGLGLFSKRQLVVWIVECKALCSLFCKALCSLFCQCTFSVLIIIFSGIILASVEITKKMQPCNRIYYSTVHWRLNMFRAGYRSSSGALTVFAASGLHTYVVTGRSQVWVGLNYGRSPHAYVNQRLQIQLELLMMSSIPLETCWAFNERWNNKFYYKVASCWLFLLSHIAMHGSMNIKFIQSFLVT